MTFNMGIGRLLEFRMMLAAVREANWSEAAKQMLDSLWASQVKTRATELAEQMQTGSWFNPEA
jgi:lysozyme